LSVIAQTARITAIHKTQLIKPAQIVMMVGSIPVVSVCKKSRISPTRNKPGIRKTSNGVKVLILLKKWKGFLPFKKANPFKRISVGETEHISRQGDILDFLGSKR